MKLIITDGEKEILLRLLHNRQLQLAKNIQNAINTAPQSQSHLKVINSLIHKVMKKEEDGPLDKCGICGVVKPENKLVYAPRAPYGLCLTCYVNSTAE